MLERKRCAFSSLCIYTAQTRIAQLQPHFQLQPVPAPSAFPENTPAYAPHKETAESRRRYVSLTRWQTMRVWPGSTAEICGRVLHRLLLLSKTGIYAPLTKISINSCFLFGSGLPGCLLRFLCCRSKADDPRRLRRNHKAAVSRIRSMPSSPRRNSETLRSTGRTAFACLALFGFPRR